MRKILALAGAIAILSPIFTNINAQYVGDKLPRGTLLDENGMILPSDYLSFYYSDEFEQYSVDDGKYRYVVPYKISNGNLTKMSMNCNGPELDLVAVSGSDGNYLTIALPRYLLDSKTGGQQDTDFIVMQDSEKKQFTELDVKDSKLRILLIPLSSGKSHINIIGWNYPEQRRQYSCMGMDVPPISYPLAPLKQLYSGTPINQIRCKVDLSLITSSFGLPACVTQKTKQVLMERGWAPVQTTPDHTSCSTEEMIVTGRIILPSCPISYPQIVVVNRTSTGFANVTRTESAISENFVLEAGHNGTITYTLHMERLVLPVPFGYVPKENATIANYAQFIHYKTLSLNDLEDYPETTLRKSMNSFSTCFETPNGQSCRGELTNNYIVNAYVYDHPGVHISFDRDSEFLTPDKNETLSVKFFADGDAQLGTYLVVLPSGICDGAAILLTIVCPDGDAS